MQIRVDGGHWITIDTLRRDGHGDAFVGDPSGQRFGDDGYTTFSRDDIDGVHVAYCIELPDPMNTEPTQALVSSFHEALPDRLIGEPGQDIDNPEFLDRGDLDSFSVNDIQIAQRGLVTDEIDGTTLTGAAGALWQDAIHFGAGFRPGEGDVIGQIFDPVDESGADNGQVFIAALAFDALSQDCICL